MLFFFLLLALKSVGLSRIVTFPFFFFLCLGSPKICKNTLILHLSTCRCTQLCYLYLTSITIIMIKQVPFATLSCIKCPHGALPAEIPEVLIWHCSLPLHQIMILNDCDLELLWCWLILPHSPLTEWNSCHFLTSKAWLLFSSRCRWSINRGTDVGSALDLFLFHKLYMIKFWKWIPLSVHHHRFSYWQPI